MCGSPKLLAIPNLGFPNLVANGLLTNNSSMTLLKPDGMGFKGIVETDW